MSTRKLNQPAGRIAALVLMLVVCWGELSTAKAETAYPVDWTRQLGTAGGDYAWGVATDTSGNVLITGITAGSLGGPNAGSGDTYVAKYDSTGTLIWTSQLGGTYNEVSYGVATDGSDNVFITGSTEDALGGPNPSYNTQPFLLKYDSAGSLTWARQLNVVSSEALAVATDASGNAFITGYTFDSIGGPNSGDADAFLTKYDSSGTLAWSRQLGASGKDWAKGVTTDSSGNIVITGYTYSSLGGVNAGSSDAFVAKYDASGTLAWTRQLGTSLTDQGTAAATDTSGNIYITGFTSASLGGPSSGLSDAFLAKYDTSGNLAWVEQLGSSGNDLAYGVVTDASGNVFITGRTNGSLGGANAGGYDVFMAKYDSSGALLWTEQLGIATDQNTNGAAIDAAGNVFAAGTSLGSFGGPSAGGDDAFLIKFAAPAAVPLPSATALGLTALFSLVSIKVLGRGTRGDLRRS